MKKFLAVIVLGLCLTGPAAAADDKESDGDKVICKRQKTLGSNLSAKRICRTKSQWEGVERDTKRELRGMSDRAFDPTPIPNPR